MRFIPANFKLSEHVVTLNDVASYYDNSKNAIEQYYDPSFVNPSLVGLSPREVKAKRDKLLRELSIECGMMLMSAVEAAFRSDFVLRCRKSKKEQIDRDFKMVLEGVKELYQVRIKEDLIDRWAEEYPADRHNFSLLKNRFDYRNWVAHGRYWNKFQNAGISSMAFTSLLMEVQNAMAIVDPRLQKI